MNTDDTTRVERPDPTRVSHGYAAPASDERQPREPLDPEHRAWLIALAIGAPFAALAILGVTLLSKDGNTEKAREKTEQVTACTKIEDPTAALACISQIDR